MNLTNSLDPIKIRQDRLLRAHAQRHGLSWILATRSTGYDHSRNRLREVLPPILWQFSSCCGNSDQTATRSSLGSASTTYKKKNGLALISVISLQQYNYKDKGLGWSSDLSRTHHRLLVDSRSLTLPRIAGRITTHWKTARSCGKAKTQLTN